MSRLTFSDSSGGYSPCPAGLHPGVCIDILDHGIEASPWGDRHMVSFVFKVEVDGEVYFPRKKMKFSNHEKSNMGQMIRSWTGSLPSPGEDPDIYYEKTAQINIIHDERADGNGVWANIDSVLPAGNIEVDKDIAGYSVPDESIIYDDHPFG